MTCLIGFFVMVGNNYFLLHAKTFEIYERCADNFAKSQPTL